MLTRTGIVHWERCPGRIENDPPLECVDYEPTEDDEDVTEEEADWRCNAAAWTIPDFFQVLQQQYLDLQWLPISTKVVWNASWPPTPGEEDLVPTLQGIYRQHGWPDLESYRKEECLQAVRKALEDKFPEALQRVRR